MTAPAVDPGAATRRWPHLPTSAVSAFYVYLLLWLALAGVAGALVLRGDALVITSGSMEPRVRTGDVVITTPTRDATLDAGTVIAFRDAARDGRIVTHRIVELTDDGYVTQGDASQSPDPFPVPADAVIGTGRIVVPSIGLPVVWARSGDWVPFLAWAAATLLAASVVSRPAGPRPAAVPPAPRFPSILPPPEPVARTRVILRRPHPAAPSGRAARQRSPNRTISTVGLSILVVSLAVGTANAAFSAGTASAGNTFTALGLDAPTDVIVECTRPNGEITVTWSAPATPYDGFLVLRTDDTGVSVELVPTPPTDTQLIDSVDQRVTYTYAVVSTLADWRSGESTTDSAVCEPGPGGGGPGGGDPTGGGKPAGGAATLTEPVDETSSTPVT